MRKEDVIGWIQAKVKDFRTNPTPDSEHGVFFDIEDQESYTTRRVIQVLKSLDYDLETPKPLSFTDFVNRRNSGPDGAA